MSVALWWLIALGAGLCSTLQSALNTNTTKTSGPYAAMASNSVFFFIGTFLYVLYGISQKQFSLNKWTELQWTDYRGGIFGFGVVLLLTLSFPRLGALTTVALMILGQSLVALIVDSQGLWGVPVVAISAQRLVAIGLILGGVILMNRV